MIISSSIKDAFNLKVNLMPTLILEIFFGDYQAFKTQLQNSIEKAPKMFDGASILIDFSKFNANDEFDIKRIKGLLKACSITLIGVKNCPDTLKAQMTDSHTNIIYDNKNIRKPDAQKQHSTIVHKKTIRSGQQIYAKNADLIIFGSVSPGAEIIADGSIYLYGVLRGKAIAGANNNKDARLLINDFQGELIAIAGKYKTADSITHNTGLHIYMENDTLVFDEI